MGGQKNNDNYVGEKIVARIVETMCGDGGRMISFLNHRCILTLILRHVSVFDWSSNGNFRIQICKYASTHRVEVRIKQHFVLV